MPPYTIAMDNSMNEVYLGLGGNIGNTASILQQALQLIKKNPAIYGLTPSRFYVTTPVSSMPQPMYLNAACRFHTTLTAQQLLCDLQQIELSLGKTPKDKQAPRIIDIDLLLFGLDSSSDERLTIPHPKWLERLFVLIPLMDLVQEISYPNPLNPDEILSVHLPSFIKTFQNINNEIVLLWKE